MEQTASPHVVWVGISGEEMDREEGVPLKVTLKGKLLMTLIPFTRSNHLQIVSWAGDPVFNKWVFVGHLKSKL